MHYHACLSMRALFQEDDAVAISALADELSEDAQININGNCLTPTLFREVITSQFRDVFLARVISITDLNVILLNPEGTTGVVAQNSKYETKGKADGQVLVQSATTIVQVEEQNGKKVIMSIFEARTVDEQ
ncbi:hypothetical protein C368_06778 [Cryptococcus neoformans 125.91]|nr:hypothetical protein C368_06778 [Cryptococcus neoformans var. grubii 125.91]